MSIEFLDPTHEESSGEFLAAARLETMLGTTVGIFSNNKKGTLPFFDAFEKELFETYGVSKIVRRIKSNYSAPADPHIVEEMAEWDAVISGVGD